MGHGGTPRNSSLALRAGRAGWRGPCAGPRPFRREDCAFNDEFPSSSKPTLAAVIRQFGPSYVARFGSMPWAQRKAMQAIEACRTAALGGHVLECKGCQDQEYAYHSCRHRSCPKCMHDEAEEWYEARRRELLPVPYFHIVLSVPAKLVWLIRTHQHALYPVLMQAAAATLLEVGAKKRYLGGTVGVLAMLHTWTRTLMYHPHVHCLVPAGSVDANGQWHGATRPSLAPEKVLSKVFRAKLSAMVRAAVPGIQLPASSAYTWKVYAEQPKHGADAVLRYLAYNGHRGAMSNHRIVEITATDVVFKYRERGSDRWRFMRVGGHEYLRRFLQHVLPGRVHRVRYFGLWSRKSKQQREAVRQQLSASASATDTASVAVAPNASTPAIPAVPSWMRCPHCNGQRIILCRFGRGKQPPPLRRRTAVSTSAQPP